MERNVFDRQADRMCLMKANVLEERKKERERLSSIQIGQSF
jgi:hypothetical protein